MTTRRLSFCLCPGFSLFSLGSALDVLRHANRFTDGEFYGWQLLCETGNRVADGNGLALPVDGNFDDAGPCDIAFVVAGFDAGQLRQQKMLAWLNRQAQHGNRLGGISNGAFVLAEAGLLNHYNATTHWEDFESFCLLYPEIRARYQRYVIDRSRITCAGGSATLDLFIELARQDLGNEIALRISRQMLLQEQSVAPLGIGRSGQLLPQTSPAVQRALKLIDGGIGQTVTVQQLSDDIGISRRELLRLFQKELGKSPSRVLAERRLDRARSLVLNTNLSMAIIADSVGFSSQSHLTSSYHDEFGTTPARQRRDYRAARDRLPLMSRDSRDW